MPPPPPIGFVEHKNVDYRSWNSQNANHSTANREDPDLTDSAEAV